MEQTATIPIKEYDELRLFKQTIENGNILRVNVFRGRFRGEADRCYYLSKEEFDEDVRQKILNACDANLEIPRLETDIALATSEIENLRQELKYKEEDIKTSLGKMSVWEFLKFRAEN